MIWRDDDVGYGTKIATLRAVDDIFRRYGALHTIAVIASGIDRRPDLVDLILERRMAVQLHCWTHDDLTVEPRAREDLARAVDLLESLFGRPTVLYPPWNKTSPEVEAAASDLGLTVSATKISLEQYLRARGGVEEDTVNFHYWHVPDVVLLEPALAIARRRRT